MPDMEELIELCKQEKQIIVIPDTRQMLEC